MNPWAQIDGLKRRMAEEHAAAVAKLMACGFKGNGRGRLVWDGLFWSFPVGGRKIEARTLDQLVVKVEAVAPRKAVAP